MQVTELWRYPVKSLGGERLDEVEVEGAGLAGDRRWALFDTSTGLGLTARRAPELLYAAATLLPDGSVRITLPDGSVADDDAALSRWLGRPVELRPADDARARTYEVPEDPDREDDESTWFRFDGSPGAFHDSAGACWTLLSRATLGDWDVRRFRPNIVVDGVAAGGEDALVGREVRVGGAVLAAVVRVPRCVMVTRPQPGGIERDLDVLRRVHRESGGELSVGGTVATPGTVRLGDEVLSS